MKKLPLIALHIGFWLFVISLRLPTLLKIEEPSYFLGVLIISMFLHIIIFYLFYFYLGKIFKRGRFGWFVVFFIPFILIWCIPSTWAFVKLFNVFMNAGFIKRDEEIVPMYITYLSVVTSQALYAILGTLVRFSVNWFNTQKYEEELEKQNIANELALLRSQINPHFLFNTLNNLHSFVYRDQDKTAFGIIKLSEIMRYMLYETNTDKVLLENEIAYLSNYIELQRLRLKDPSFVEFKTEGQFHGKQIAPLLLITFIENAFKHGRKNVDSPGIIINLKVENQTLTFDVKNYLAPKTENAVIRQGFGLKNIQRRLQLIYKDKYKLKINSESETYSVQLVINEL
jgi:two-component system, LytTR family, sensor kinase